MQNSSVSTSIIGMKKRVMLRVRHLDHGAPPVLAATTGLTGPASSSPRPPIRPRPTIAIQIGRMLSSAMNSPLPVAVMAGA